MAKITIDTDKIVEYMLENGIKLSNIKNKNFAGCSDLLLEGLDVLYSLETEIMKDISSKTEASASVDVIDFLTKCGIWVQDGKIHAKDAPRAKALLSKATAGKIEDELKESLLSAFDHEMHITKNNQKYSDELYDWFEKIDKTDFKSISQITKLFKQLEDRRFDTVFREKIAGLYKVWQNE